MVSQGNHPQMAELFRLVIFLIYPDILGSKTQFLLAIEQ